MVLRMEDFAGWQINWNDKAQNIVDLVGRLNLGLEATVFIDDHPVERARVREALPQVLVPEWPADPMLFKAALLGLRCFYTGGLNKEDLERAAMYEREKLRSDLKRRVGSVDEWLHSLQMCITVEQLAEHNLSRATQLFNKTNQMNLMTRRLTQSELMQWAAEHRHHLWTFSVSDRFGDSGLTGIVSVEVEGKRATIVDFILSCRVMGRKVEETMLHTVIDYARARGLEEVLAVYIATPRNEPCLTFFHRSGFRVHPESLAFSWKVEDPYILPPHIKVRGLPMNTAISLGHV